MDNDKNIYSAQMLKELEDCVRTIRNVLKDEILGHEKIAFSLHWIYINRMYKAMGCNNIGDYAFQQFNFKKTATYDYISVAERFGERLEGLYTGVFEEKYRDYSFSKLALMVNMTDAEIEAAGITPEMSVRDIKKAAKDIMQQDTEPDSATGQPGLEDTEPAEPDADENGLVGYSLEMIMKFNKKEAVFPAFSSEIEDVIKKAFEQYDHPETAIEIIVRYPVFKKMDKPDT